MVLARALNAFATMPSTFGHRSATGFAARIKNAHRGSALAISVREFGRGQGDAGGWPSSTDNPSGGGRSNKRPRYLEELKSIRKDVKDLRQQVHKFHVKKSRLTNDYKKQHKETIGRTLQALIDKLNNF
mmetsp:Transcript_23403/g.67438  ORF Transcript_23403/g.67438 Transcript_23403/m.67438 type:complete len:129 (+) Transcript_23403:1547-1933(+)